MYHLDFRRLTQDLMTLADILLNSATAQHERMIDDVEAFLNKLPDIEELIDETSISSEGQPDMKRDNSILYDFKTKLKIFC